MHPCPAITHRDPGYATQTVVDPVVATVDPGFLVATMDPGPRVDPVVATVDTWILRP